MSSRPYPCRSIDDVTAAPCQVSPCFISAAVSRVGSGSIPSDDRPSTGTEESDIIALYSAAVS